jgi:hypothetical protein
MTAFTYEINSLLALQGVVRSLTGVPIRRDRQAIIAAADRALPKSVVGQVFMAIGSGGELSQMGAAETIVDALLPNATFELSSHRGARKTYTCNLTFSVGAQRFMARVWDRPSLGVAVLAAVIDGLIAATRADLQPTPARMRAGQPVTP